jgi:hypothetical protein
MPHTWEKQRNQAAESLAGQRMILHCVSESGTEREGREQKVRQKRWKAVILSRNQPGLDFKAEQ